MDFDTSSVPQSSSQETKIAVIRSAIIELQSRINELNELSVAMPRNLLDPASEEEENARGDVAWLLSATVFVLLMSTPGITLYYSGMVRLQNVLSTAMQGYSIACIVTFLWMAFGYSLAFSPANGSDHDASVFGNSQRLWLAGIMEGSHQLAPTVPETAFCAFQLAFAIITPCLICGAFADRMKFSAVVISLGLWHLLVYCPIAHSQWHPDGFLYKAGNVCIYVRRCVYIASFIVSGTLSCGSGSGCSNFITLSTCCMYLFQHVYS